MKIIKCARASTEELIGKMNQRIQELEGGVGSSMFAGGQEVLSGSDILNEQDYKIAQSVFKTVDLPEGYEWGLDVKEDKFGVPVVLFQILKDGDVVADYSWGMGMSQDDPDFDMMEDISFDGYDYAIQDALQQLVSDTFGDVESATNSVKSCGNAEVNSSEDVEPTLGEDDPDERYLHTLIGDLDAKLEELGYAPVIEYDADRDECIYITLVDNGDHAQEFKVPFADLSFNFDNMESDVAYIVDAIEG